MIFVLSTLNIGYVDSVQVIGVFETFLLARKYAKKHRKKKSAEWVIEVMNLNDDKIIKTYIYENRKWKDAESQIYKYEKRFYTIK